MKLTIAGTPESRCGDMTVRSGAAGDGADIDVLGSQFESGALKQRFSASDEVAAVLFYARPEHFLARALSSGSEPDGRMEEWKNAAEALLAVFRQNRPKVLLFEDEAARKKPEAVRALVSQRLRTDLQLISGGSEQDSPAPTAVEQALAARYVAASPELSDLAGELEAAAFPLAAAAPDNAVSVMEAWREYRELQSELEKLKSDQQIATENPPVAPTAGDTDHAKELEEENEVLLLQLHQAQEELEQYYLEATDLKQQRSSVSEYELQELAEYILSLEKLLLKLLSSRTWKLMAPVRQAGRIMKGIVRRRRVPRTRLPKRPSSLVRIAGERS